MGTRNLTAVVADGEYRIAQYGQWGGYPDGQGRTALAFCREHLAGKLARNAFRTKLKNVRLVSAEERNRYAEEMKGAPDGAFWKRYPAFSRDHGAEILGMVAASDGEIILQNSIDFAGDSVFCEWAYVIDLDKCTLEVFKGFNKQPLELSERFASAPRDPEGNPDYYPVRHVRSWKLDDLPSEKTFTDELHELTKSPDDD